MSRSGNARDDRSDEDGRERYRLPLLTQALEERLRRYPDQLLDLGLRLARSDAAG